MACWLTIAKVSVPHQLTPLLWACGKHITVEQTTRLVPQMPKKRGWDPSLPVGFKGASPDGTLPSRPVLSFRYLPIVSGEQAFSTWASWRTLQSQTIAVRAAIWELSVKLSGPPRPSLNVISRGPVPPHSACRVRWPMHQTPSAPPHTLSHRSGAPKSSICDLPDLPSAWERGTWETYTDLYVRDAQIIFLQNMSWCPVSCLALLSGSYCLFSLSPNFQFSTCLPWRTPTWDHIKGEVGVGLQWGDHWACSVPRPTWGHL